MKKISKRDHLILFVGLLGLGNTGNAFAAPVINSVITSYSQTGVPTSVTVFGTGLCAASNCLTKPSVTLGGIALTSVTGTPTGVTAQLGLVSDGDYVLKLTAGSSSANYQLTLRALSVGVVGPTGPAGPIGLTGATGNPGLPGASGADGQQGPAGSDGAFGATGPAGEPGPAGQPGVQGAKGDKGDSGDIGPSGSTGMSGPDGTFPAGSSTGAMLYWNGSGWSEVASIPTNGAVLRFCSGRPSWSASCPDAFSATLRGKWNFNAPTPTDSTGFWTGFSFGGTAKTANGSLVVIGTGDSLNAATAWAMASGYLGPVIQDKTLVAWAAIDTTVGSGAAIGLARISDQVFDSVVWGERGNLWMAGSNSFTRTDITHLAAAEVFTTKQRLIGIAYKNNLNGTQTITECLDGVVQRNYVVNSIAEFTKDDTTAVLFGPRLFWPGGTYGSLNANINEARIYGTALSCSEISALLPD